MAEQEPHPSTWPEALAIITVKFIDRGGVGAALIAIAMLTGVVNRGLEIVKKLLVAGPIHFWSFIAVTVVSLALITMMRRQSLNNRQLAVRIRELCDDNERLMRLIEQRPMSLLPGPVNKDGDGPA